MDRQDEEFEAFLGQFQLRTPAPLPEGISVRSRQPRRRPFRWVLAAAAIAGVAFLSGKFVRNFERLHGPRATVEIAGSNSLYKIGQTIDAGDVVRSNDAEGVVLGLEDGSHIEMRSQSALALEAAKDGVRIRLNGGSIIVTAAKQGFGHLYVQTKDALISVVGTVFLVTAESSATRVAVVQGEVHVQQGSTLRKLLPGEQVSTDTSIALRPVAEAIAWSRSARTYVALLLPSTQRGGDGIGNVVQQQNEYCINDVKVVGVSASGEEALIRSFIGFKNGDFYNEDQLRRGFENMKDFYGRRGNHTITPEPSFDFNERTNTVDLTVSIESPGFTDLRIAQSEFEQLGSEMRVAYSILRGEKAADDGRYSDAAEAFRQAYDVNPKSSLASFRFAEARFQLGDFDTALQMFRDSLNGDLNPKWIEVWAHINTGKIYDIRNQRDRAVPEYQKAIGTHDDFHGAQGTARKYLAVAFQQEGGQTVPQQSNSKQDSAGKRTFGNACTTCHNAAAAGSAHYATRGEYESLVSGQRAIGASVPDSEIPALIDYLFENFGKKTAQRANPAASKPQSYSAQDVSGLQIFQRNCTLCHDAQIATSSSLSALGLEFSSSDRQMLSDDQAEQAKLINRGFTLRHPDVMRLQDQIDRLKVREAGARRRYSEFVSNHLKASGGRISEDEMLRLVDYLIDVIGRIPADTPVFRNPAFK